MLNFKYLFYYVFIALFLIQSVSLSAHLPRNVAQSPLFILSMRGLWSEIITVSSADLQKAGKEMGKDGVSLSFWRDVYDQHHFRQLSPESFFFLTNFITKIRQPYNDQGEKPIIVLYISPHSKDVVKSAFAGDARLSWLKNNVIFVSETTDGRLKMSKLLSRVSSVLWIRSSSEAYNFERTLIHSLSHEMSIPVQMLDIPDIFLWKSRQNKKADNAPHLEEELNRFVKDIRINSLFCEKQF